MLIWKTYDHVWLVPSISPSWRMYAHISDLLELELPLQPHAAHANADWSPSHWNHCHTGSGGCCWCWPVVVRVAGLTGFSVYPSCCTALQFCTDFRANGGGLNDKIENITSSPVILSLKGNIYVRKRPERCSTHQSAPLASLTRLFKGALSGYYLNGTLLLTCTGEKLFFPPAFSKVFHRLSGHRELQLSLSLRHKAADLIANSKFRGPVVGEWEHCSRDHPCGEEAESSQALQL